MNIDNILKFLKLRRMSAREFERSLDLGNATLSNTIKRGADLTDDIIIKVVEKYSTDLKEAGFEIIDLTQYNKGYIIVEGERKSRQKDEVSEDVNLVTISKKLDQVLTQQVLTRAEVRSFGEYQVMKDAKGVDSVRREIMEQINKLIGANLGSGVITGN